MGEIPPEKGGVGLAGPDATNHDQDTTLLNDLEIGKKQGERAELFKKSLPKVQKIAWSFVGRGLEYNELVSAGMIGLGEAIDKFRDGSNNGLAAYADKWISGSIKRALRKSYWTVGGKRNEGSNAPGAHKPHLASVAHFGNVTKGDGTYKADYSSNAEIQTDGEHADDADDGGGTHLDRVVDHSLESITGDRWSWLNRHLDDRERRVLTGRRRGLTFKELGAELGVADTRCEQIAEKAERKLGDLAGTFLEAREYEWLYQRLEPGPRHSARTVPDFDARLFLAEARQYCQHGIGFMYRPRRQDKIPWKLLPSNQLYKEPAWTTHRETKTDRCICMRCCPTPLLPAGYAAHHTARLVSHMRVTIGWAPKKTNRPGPEWISIALGYSTGVEIDDDTGPQAWTGWRKWRRGPQCEWRVKARAKPFARHIGLEKKDDEIRWRYSEDIVCAPPAVKTTNKSQRDYLDYRHIDHKGVLLENPVRQIRAKGKAKRRKAPTLPPELYFLSRIGAASWRKIARRSPPHFVEAWSPVVPYVLGGGHPGRGVAMKTPWRKPECGEREYTVAEDEPPITWGRQESAAPPGMHADVWRGSGPFEMWRWEAYCRTHSFHRPKLFPKTMVA